MNQTQNEPSVAVKCCLCATHIWVPEWQTKAGMAFYCTGCSTKYDDAPKKTPPSILHEAEQIINGPRRESYGDVKDSFGRVALFWSEIIGAKVTTQQVAMCMMALKLCREINRPSRDNRTDLCGYAALLDKLVDSQSPEPTQSASDNG